MENMYQEDLRSIRKLMERSVKVISLSGLSGILAGCYALAGAGFMYQSLTVPFGEYLSDTSLRPELNFRFIAVAAIVLLASLLTAWILSYRKAGRMEVSLWNTSTQRLLINFSIPLLAGGIFLIILLAEGYVGLAAPACLLFYGLALVMASPNAYDEIRYLGFCEIALGLSAAAWPAGGLLLWSIGFGLLHVLYGGLMYKKYER